MYRIESTAILLYPELPVVVLSFEGYNYLWGKTREAFHYIYHNHFSDADWFLKADDDTYVVMENLRYLLNEYDANDPAYYGYRVKNPRGGKQDYMLGSAYVLSKEALKRLIDGLYDPAVCCQDPYNRLEDMELGICLENVGVKAVDTRDRYRRNTFLPVFQKKPWYWFFVYFRFKGVQQCCSEYSISFHKIEPFTMYVLEYFIYHLKPYGIKNNFQESENIVVFPECVSSDKQ